MGVLTAGSGLMAVGLAEQPWALSPPNSLSTGTVCTMRRKYSQRERKKKGKERKEKNLPDERGLSETAVWFFSK